ncbi:uncharacterized protein LOC133505582 isoform X2 [Syngnathoides biaculeatus]|uniref:uncharacterized protein LOC133505582 isoform X2 n=1 Tax=Syngnathoides biaculeatus TaxID=300417 RepID=UPI002ADE6DD4|nr:uncharacterized protein LOC133505582 isoform X2 [Syngnathoides biaculeatus]
MTRTTVTKIVILAVFIFIMCLPEFWTSDGESKIKLLCLPCDRRRDNTSADAAVTSERSPETDATCVTCERLDNGPQLESDNRSASPNVDVEMSVHLRVGDVAFLKLAFSGQRSGRRLHLRPPEDGAPSRCRPAESGSRRPDRLVCLLRLWNGTVWRGNQKRRRTQEDEWGAVFRILWLVLSCAVLLTLSSACFRQMKRNRRCCGVCRLPEKVHPLGYVKDGGKDAEIKTLKGGNVRRCEPRPRWAGLASIEEMQVAEHVQSGPDGHVDHSHPTAHLHHRPSVTFPHGGAELPVVPTQL